MARRFGEDEEKWGMAGILHDIDYEKTKDNPSQHSLVGAQMLEDAGLDKEICQAIRAHNATHGIPLNTPMDKALFVADPITGLIVAATLVLPSRRIADLTAENVLNRFHEKSFAKGANREIIKRCEELLDIKLEEFADISVKAMQRYRRRTGTLISIKILILPSRKPQQSFGGLFRLYSASVAKEKSATSGGQSGGQRGESLFVK